MVIYTYTSQGASTPTHQLVYPFVRRQLAKSVLLGAVEG